MCTECGNELSKQHDLNQIRKLKRVFLFSLLSLATLLNGEDSLLSLIDSAFTEDCMLSSFSTSWIDPKSSFYIHFLKEKKQNACPVSCEFLFSSFLTLPSSVTEFSYLPAGLLFSGIGRNQSVLMNLSPKDIGLMGKCVELFMTLWIQSHCNENQCSFFTISFSLFLTQFAFNQRYLPEITHCSLYFRQILGYFRTVDLFA